jgi:competence protein ComEA
VKITPVSIAIAVAALIAIVVAFVVRPAALFVHPNVAPAIVRTAEPTPALPPPRLMPKPLVYVAGAVVHPGVYPVDANARAVDALAKAGGATHDADLVAVNLAAHIADGDEIAVPHIGERATIAPHAKRARGGHGRGSHRRRRTSPEPSEASPAALLDLNSASEEALADLPGIGPVLAERIVEFRQINGPFSSVDGLADVAGITPAHLDELETLVTVAR